MQQWLIGTVGICTYGDGGRVRTILVSGARWAHCRAPTGRGWQGVTSKTLSLTLSFTESLQKNANLFINFALSFRASKYVLSLVAKQHLELKEARGFVYPLSHRRVNMMVVQQTTQKAKEKLFQACWEPDSKSTEVKRSLSYMTQYGFGSDCNCIQVPPAPDT